MTQKEKILRSELIEVVIRNFSNDVVFENKKDLNIYILSQLLEENLVFETKVFELSTTDNNEFRGIVCSSEDINDNNLHGYEEDEYLSIEFCIKSKNDKINVKHLNV